ncbi:RNA polymerase sigma factor [Pedobacter steynii]|uniref:RNA polymerase sigma factor n=1 Tax=Pedobacter steynii TaxID=430522 RepID=UPI0021502342|nr:sigma-70 family RNA polymerase sigma factor [Pedobacter steynii]
MGGDRQAFSQLFEARYPGLYAFALKLTRSPVLSEEIIQDVFLNIWLNRSGLGNVANFRAYLHRIARNLSLNALRNIAKHKVLVGDFEADENFPDHSTEYALDYKDTVALMHKAIEKLPPQQQQVYNLCHKEGLTYEQAALRLNIAPATVHSHMKGALRGLRVYFKKMGIPMVIVALILR